MNSILDDNTVQDQINFYVDPNYASFASINSVLEPKAKISNQEFFEWSNSSTEMALLLRAYRMLNY